MSKVSYTCPACGFLTLDDPNGDSICNFCNWHDDPVQKQFPAIKIGANNKFSLCQLQAAVLKKYPVEVIEIEIIKKHRDETVEKVTYKRDLNWTALTTEDCQPKEGQPTNGKDWFDKMPGKRVTFIDGEYK